MKRQITTLAVLAGLTLPAGAEDEQKKKEQPARPAVTKKTPDELPDGIARFNGMLIGRLVKKDVEKGTFILNVDAVPRVWRNSKAENQTNPRLGFEGYTASCAWRGGAGRDRRCAHGRYLRIESSRGFV